MDTGAIAVMIPVVAIVGGITAGIINNLMKHQREMALILRNQHEGSQQRNPELDSLRREVAMLRDQLNAVAISTDTVMTQQPPPTPDALSQRLEP